MKKENYKAIFILVLALLIAGGIRVSHDIKLMHGSWFDGKCIVKINKSEFSQLCDGGRYTAGKYRIVNAYYKNYFNEISIFINIEVNNERKQFIIPLHGGVRLVGLTMVDRETGEKMRLDAID